jgi:Tfp pilus assembly protein PilX
MSESNIAADAASTEANAGRDRIDTESLLNQAESALREVEEQVQSPYYSHTTTILFLVISMLIVIINIFKV